MDERLVSKSKAYYSDRVKVLSMKRLRRQADWLCGMKGKLGEFSGRDAFLDH